MADLSQKSNKAASAAQARQVIDVFHEISTLLVGFFFVLFEEGE